MKTPVEELFELLWDTPKDKFTWYAIRNRMVKKEKEVIENAVKQGWDYNEEGLVQWMGEKYYNETFNTKEK
jgi:hypothetical protein